jgi:hypothetical protein
MARFGRSAFCVVGLISAVACVPSRSATSASFSFPSPTSPAAGPNVDVPLRPDSSCADCNALSSRHELAQAVETRIGDLKARGGDCSRLGAVIEASYRSGQITLRPYMWRVGSHLASGEARPNGAMVLAREVDSLNVGVRTVDDVLWTMEHEAAHIAFDLASGSDATEEKVNQTVRACKI